MNADNLIRAAMQQQAQPQQQQSPQSILNDVQLVSLVAAEIYSGKFADAAVEVAMEIVAEAFVQLGPNSQNLVKLVQAKIALRREAN